MNILTIQLGHNASVLLSMEKDGKMQIVGG